MFFCSGLVPDLSVTLMITVGDVYTRELTLLHKSTENGHLQPIIQNVTDLSGDREVFIWREVQVGQPARSDTVWGTLACCTA